MPRPLVLLDVDETLLDVNYQLTVPLGHWREAVDRAQARGATVGLNSDTSFPHLQRWARQYGIHGPIIAERGALFAPTPVVAPTATVPVAARFPEFRTEFLLTLLAPRKVLDEYLVCFGDINALSKQLPRLTPDVCLAGAAVFVNGLRQASFSLYVRRRGPDGSWEKDEGALDAVLGQVTSVIARSSWLCGQEEIDRNPAYGICIVHHRDSQKRAALAPLLTEIGEHDPLIMVGNSCSDLLGSSQVLQCAVGNADPAYKAACAHVAERDRAAGVIELLEKLL